MSEARCVMISRSPRRSRRPGESAIFEVEKGRQRLRRL
jgi:hypothetical protein